MNAQRVCFTICFGLLLSEPTLQAQPPMAWYWRNPQPQGDQLNAVSFGNGRFVAVGVHGRIVVSDDGAQWAMIRSGVTGNLSSIAFGNGVHVAVRTDRELGVEGGFIIVSSDGSNWAPVLSGQWPFAQISFEQGRFFATSVGGGILSSADGMEWAQERPNGFRPASNVTNLSGVAYGNSQFVAMGNRSLLTSPDGLHWRQELAPAAFLDPTGSR